MQRGVVKEIKDQEHRVALTPAGAAALVHAGHIVSVEAGAGLGSGFPDAASQAVGASVVAGDAAWETELIVKVKEPLAPDSNSNFDFTGDSRLLMEADFA